MRLAPLVTALRRKNSGVPFALGTGLFARPAGFTFSGAGGAWRVPVWGAFGVLGAGSSFIISSSRSRRSAALITGSCELTPRPVDRCAVPADAWPGPLAPRADLVDGAAVATAPGAQMATTSNEATSTRRRRP